MATNNQGLGEILKLPPKEHHPKMIGLVIVICICIVFIGWYLYYRVSVNNQNTVPAEYSMAQAIQDSLATLRSKGVSPATQSEIQASLKELSKSKVRPASQSEIDQSLSQLKAQ